MRPIRFVSLLAACCLFGFASLAQEEPPVEEPPPSALTTKSYDLSGLVESGDVPKVQDLLAPDRVFASLELPEDAAWPIRNCRGGAASWTSGEEAMQYVLAFCNPGDSASYRGDPSGTTVCVEADEELHGRIAWVLAALKASAAVRVRLNAYTLPPGPAATLVLAEAEKLAQSGTLLGSVGGALGETLLLQHAKPLEFIQGYDLSQDGSVSVAGASLCSGREVVAGALLLPDGRIWLCGWCSRLELTELREVQSTCGKLECPRAAYSCVPFSTLLDNNGAAVIDEGPLGRTLLACSVEGSLPNKTTDAGARTTLGLVNITSTVQARFPLAPWLAGSPNEARLGRVLASSEPWARRCVLHPVTSDFAELLEVEAETLGAVVPLGPYVGVRISQQGGDGDASPEDFEAARKRMAELLKQINAGRKPAELRVQAWRAKSVPASFAQGKATARELAALGAPAFDRGVLTLEGQAQALFDMEVAALVTGDSGAPELGVASWGAQLQLLLRQGASGPELELRFGLVETDGDRKVKTSPVDGKVKFERATRKPSVAEVSGPLAKDGLLYSVVPAGDGFLVVAVQRTK